MALHQRNASMASSTKTSTPTDSWESYFDSWSEEDLEISDFPQPPAPRIIEPVILDDDLYHPDHLLHNNFDLDHALDLDLDWDLDSHYQDYQARCSPKAFGKLNDATPSSKRHGICVSTRRSSRGSVHQIHPIRSDRRSAPVKKRADDVEGRAFQMANTNAMACVAPESQIDEHETTKSQQPASKDSQTYRSHQQPYVDLPETARALPYIDAQMTATSQGRRVGHQIGGQQNRQAKLATSRAPESGLGVETWPNPPTEPVSDAYDIIDAPPSSNAHAADAPLSYVVTRPPPASIISSWAPNLVAATE